MMLSLNAHLHKYIYPEWYSWPKGECGHNITEALTCPMCETKLRSVQCNGSYDNGYELWYFVCPRCKTRYTESVPAGSVKAQSADPRDDEIAELREAVALLQKQTRYLYDLIQELQRQPQKPKQIISLNEKNNNADHDDFTEKYRHLIN